MRTYSADALILRTYRYGEADRIVVFLTQDRGKRRGVAKHATVSRRRFGAALEPLTAGRVTYVERETRDLVRLDRIEVQAGPWRAAQGRASEDAVQVLGHAAYFAELLDEWAPDGLPNERLFRLGAAVMAGLANGGSVEALARYFEYWLLQLEGVYPRLEVCAHCGEGSWRHGAALLMAQRVFVCQACGAGGLQLSPAAMLFLQRTVRETPDTVGARGAPAAAMREIERAHARLIAAHLEKELRSARVVKELRPPS